MMAFQTLAKAAPVPAASKPPIQKKTAIGPVDDPLEHEASRAADAVVTGRPPGAAGGAPLTPGKRAYFEPRPAGPRLPIQAKLKVGAVNDPLEQEADRVADQVMRMPAPEVGVTPARPQVSRKCAECEEVEEKLQRKEAGPRPAAPEAPAIVHEVLRSPGQPLDPKTRAYFEPRFGRDFSAVRVHADAHAAESARGINANAYTVGHNMVFGAGQFAPGTQEGRRLFAHELAHVVQQSGADGNSVGQNNENCGGSSISQPVAEGRAVARCVQRQAAGDPNEIQSYVFAGDKKLSTDKNFAQSRGLEIAARIRKNDGKVSFDDRLELKGMLDFFQGEAKELYVQEVQSALADASKEIQMPAEYAGAVNRPVDVLEAIVHIMAGNQVSGDYGPAGENVMHPQYYIDVKKNITKKEYIELLWEWFRITNGTVTAKSGVQFIVQGSMARVRIPRAVADTEPIIAEVGTKEGAKWVARYKAKVQEFTLRAVREEVSEMIEAGVNKEREPKPNTGAMSEHEQVKGVAVKAAAFAQQLGGLARRTLASQAADRVNARVRQIYLKQLTENFGAPSLRSSELASKMSFPDAITWLKGGLDAASAILTLTDPAARKQLFEARASYFGTAEQGLEISKVLGQFVSGAVAFCGAGTYGLARALGKADLAAQVLEVSTKWTGNVAGALLVVGTLHGLAVLIDPDATSNERAAAAVEFASSALGVASFASRWTPRLAAAGRWGNPIGVSLSLNFLVFSKLADLQVGAAIGLTRFDWVSCFKATRGAAQEAQEWMRKLAVTNLLIAQESDPARLSELRKEAEVYRNELMDGHVKPYLAARLRADKAKGDPDDCGPALTNRFKPMVPVLDSNIDNDDAALSAAAMFLNLSFTALNEWDDIVASSIK